MMETRLESDSIGTMEVPAEAYYGVQALRAKKNFPITGTSLHPVFIKNLALIKKAAAITNNTAGFLSKDVADAIETACDEVISGKFSDEFIVDAIQGGAGTSANMNMNEVLANRAGELLGDTKGNYSLIGNPEVYQAVDEHIVNFYLKANEIIYEACKDHLDAVIIANDFGSQLGLMLSTQMIHDFVMPGSKKLIHQAHDYGLKVIYHSCGAVFDAIPELISAGVDIVHPIQATAKHMEPRHLKQAYGDKVAFCGGVDIQDLLPNGTPEMVEAKVHELQEIFPTGLIISPSQGVILDDVPPEKIRAMLHAAL